MNALVAWLWQGAAIALATAALLAAMRRVNAATRHAVWWCAMGAVMALPLVRLLASASATSAIATSPATLPAGVFVVPAPPDAVIALAIGAWLGTLLVGVFKIAGGLKAMARLKVQSVPVDAERQARLPMWQSTARDERRPDLRVSDGARAACALGFRRPVILVSERLVDALGDEALDQVVIHEYAHLLRHDDWLRLIESAIVAVAGLHPAVRFIARQIDLEREAACDDLVVGRTGGARAYAQCLAEAAAVARGRAAGLERQLVPGATGRSASLRSRIVRLLDPRRGRGAQLAPIAMAAGLLTLAATIALSYNAVPILVADRSSALTVPPAPPAIVGQALPSAAAAANVDVPDLVPFTMSAGKPSANDPRPGVRRSPSPVAETRLSLSQLAPSDVVTALRGAAPETVPVPLASSSLPGNVHAPLTVAGSVMKSPAADRRDKNVKWSSLGAPGVAVGRGARSVAGFFGGAAKAVASSF